MYLQWGTDRNSRGKGEYDDNDNDLDISISINYIYSTTSRTRFEIDNQNHSKKFSNIYIQEIIEILVLLLNKIRFSNRYGCCIERHQVLFRVSTPSMIVFDYPTGLVHALTFSPSYLTNVERIGISQLNKYNLVM